MEETGVGGSGGFLRGRATVPILFSLVDPVFPCLIYLVRFFAFT
jgi:hypothetical protein